MFRTYAVEHLKPCSTAIYRQKTQLPIPLRWLDYSNPYNIVDSRFRRERRSAFPTELWVLGLVSPDGVSGERDRRLMSHESGNYYLKCVSPNVYILQSLRKMGVTILGRLTMCLVALNAIMVGGG